jgi:putative MATE family efflux protein
VRPSTTASGPILGNLLRLALPIIGLNILQVLSLAVDTAMVGRMELAETALTGMSFSTQLSFLLMVLMIGLTVGSVAFVARAHGANDPERVDHVVAQSATLALTLGILVAIVGNAGAIPLLTVLGAEGTDLSSGLAYLRPSLLFAPATYLNILLAAVLRGVGNTRLAFFVALGSNALNVAFNYLFILGGFGFPALGLAGAALGTGLSQLAAVVVLTTLLARGAEPALHIKLLRDLIRIGAPAAVDMVVLNAGFLSIVGMLGRIDPLAVAAHGVGLRVQALAFVPGMSISQAIGAMVGQALGANNPDRARTVLRYGVALCVVVMSTLAAIIIFGRAPLVALFDIDPNGALGGYAQQWMQLLGWCMPAVGVYIAFVGLFQGSGATRISLRINALMTLLLQIPLSWILGFTFGLGTFGVWLALPLAFVGKAILGAFFVAKGDWAQTGSRV